MAACLLVSGCTTAPPEPRTALSVGLVGEPLALLDDRDASARFLAPLVVEPLVARDDKDDLVPRLVERVPAFENGLARIVTDRDAPEGRIVVTFPLREGLAWHDGVRLTADDVVFAYERDRAAADGSRERADADLVERVQAVGERLAVVSLRPGVRTTRYPLLARAMPRHVLGGADASTESAYARRPMHAGPFTVASWQEGRLTLAPFGGYALGTPELRRVDVRFFTDREALIGALTRGQVDLVPAGTFTADLIPRLAPMVEQRGLALRFTPQMSADLLLFNLRRAFAEPRLRRAVAYAVDRKGIAAQLFGGRTRIPSTYLFPPSWAAVELGPIPDADPAAARALLSASGYCALPRCVLAPTLQLRLLVDSASPVRLTIGELVARDLAAVGAKVQLVGYSSGALAGLLAGGDFDLAIVPRRAADPAEATLAYVSGEPANVTRYQNASFDGLARLSALFLARADARPVYAELQRLWAADQPALPLYQHLAIDLVPHDLQAVAPAAHGAPLSWNAHAWRFAR